MNARSVTLLSMSLATLLLTACGGGGHDGATPDGTVAFGPYSDTPVDFRLAGTVRYEDRLYGNVAYGRYGFTGVTRFKAVRHAVVDLVDEAGNTLLTTHTDEAGHYLLSARAPGLLHLRILARTDPAVGPRISVLDNDGGLYAATRHFIPAAGSLTLDAEIPASSVAGAWNILDVCTAAAEFVREQTDQWPPAPLTAWWSPGSEEGTWFGADGIHVLGAPGDTDEYDDDVLLHEFGHFVEHFSGNADSPGGFHMLGDNTQDLRLAWSEGFASWFSGATKQWLDARRSEVLSDTSGTLSDPALGPLYLDTGGTGERLHWFFDVDYSTQPALDLAGSFATAESAVAKVLWNVTRQSGTEQLWQDYRTLPARARSDRPVSVETFWDNWIDTWPGDAPREAYRQRRIDYAADAFENDGSAQRATRLEPDHEPQPADLHTLAPGARNDVDYFRVHLAAGFRYSVETFGLLNGADTLITVYSPDDLQHPLARCGRGATAACENDNGSGESHASPAPDTDSAHRLMLNDGCKLASRLTFTPRATGSYLVRVTRARAPSPGAGRYGAYRLTISSNPSRYRCPS
jgi:hypothetical protein